jgi:hypothetical protein
MTDSILESTSFSSLDEAGKNTVRKAFIQYLQGEKPDWSAKEISRNRKTIATLLSIYSQKMAQINPAAFKYMDDSQRAVLNDELLFTFYLLSAQFQIDEAEHRRQGLKQQSDQIKSCAKLIHQLRASQEVGFAADLEAEIDNSEKHLKYLGLTVVAPFLTDKMTEFSKGKTVVTKQWMGEVNGRRLYWVWGGGMLASVIALLPDDFYNKSQAQQAVAAPSPITGYMSWVLYYTRFGINLGLLLKHTIKGPWMSAAEAEIPAWERFKTQWDLRKFSLLNDSVWATCNLLCFFWLTGSGMAGYWGNVLTAGLLLMDVCLTYWRFCEESTEHNRMMHLFAQDIQKLQDKITAEKDKDKLATLELELAELLKNKSLYEYDYKYKFYATSADLAYSIGLLIAFSVVCSFFLLPTAIMPVTAVTLGVVGAALCFTANFISAGYSGWLELSKAKESRQLAKIEGEALLVDLIAHQAERSAFVNKQLYLDIRRVLANSEHQERVIDFQKMRLMRGILVDALIPPVLFVSFVFMPLGMALAVVFAGFVLAAASNKYIEGSAPAEEKLPEFDEDEFKKFLANPSVDALKATNRAQKGLKFFSSVPNRNGEDQVLEDADAPCWGEYSRL